MTDLPRGLLAGFNFLIFYFFLNMKNENEIAAARNAAQMLSKEKKLVIARYRSGKFGLMMGQSHKSSHDTLVEVMAMTSQVKMELGVFFAYQRFICFDAIDKVKAAGLFRFGLKRQINRFLAEMDRLRKLLIDPASNGFRMFHLGDLPSATRLRFRKDLTDKEYFEFWENTGMVAFNETHKHFYALQWRYEKPLKERGVKQAKALAWFATACSLLELYTISYEKLIMRFHALFGHPEKSLREVYGGFDLTRARDMWIEAMEVLAPDADAVLASCIRERNVELGLQQIIEELTLPTRQLDFVRMNIEENREVFSSKAAWLEEIAEVNGLKADLIKTSKDVDRAKNDGLSVDEYFKLKRDEIKKKREIR